MILKDIHTLPPGWLVYVKNYFHANLNPDPGYVASVLWFVGRPYIDKNSLSGWACKVLAMDNIEKWTCALDLPELFTIPIYEEDTITLIPPQDLVKYINYLTDAGAQYLKEIHANT